MITVREVPALDWIILSENAHSAVFGTYKPKEWDRIDYALLALRDEEVLGYVTCREFDSQTLYWQFGGMLPHLRNTITSFQCYLAFRDWTKNKYERVVTYIENTNMVMLKMAMKIGYLITGIRNFQGSILLEHTLEFKKEK